MGEEGGAMEDGISRFEQSERRGEKRSGEEAHYLRYRIVIDVDNLVKITSYDL